MRFVASMVLHELYYKCQLETDVITLNLQSGEQFCNPCGPCGCGLLWGPSLGSLGYGLFLLYKALRGMAVMGAYSMIELFRGMVVMRLDLRGILHD